MRLILRAKREMILWTRVISERKERFGRERTGAGVPERHGPFAACNVFHPLSTPPKFSLADRRSPFYALHWIADDGAVRYEKYIEFESYTEEFAQRSRALVVFAMLRRIGRFELVFPFDDSLSRTFYVGGIRHAFRIRLDAARTSVRHVGDGNTRVAFAWEE